MCVCFFFIRRLNKKIALYQKWVGRALSGVLRAGLNQMAEKGEFSYLSCIIGSCSKTLECPDSPVSGLQNKVVHPSSPKPPMLLQKEPTGCFSSSLLADSTLRGSLFSIFTIRCRNLLCICTWYSQETPNTPQGSSWTLWICVEFLYYLLFLFTWQKCDQSISGIYMQTTCAFMYLYIQIFI